MNLRSLQPMGLYPANSLFVSDYLTTKGQPAEDDYRMVADLGFEIVVGDAIDARSPAIPSLPIQSPPRRDGSGDSPHMDFAPAINFTGRRVTVMGLGRFGGGEELSAFSRRVRG